MVNEVELLDRTRGYIERNEIKGYKPREVAASPAAQQTQLMQEAFEPPAASPAKPPGW